MNEELKIIITAVTSEAKKSIQGIKKELGGVTSSAQGASKGIGSAMKGIGVAAGVAVAAIAAVGVALVKLGKASLDVQKAQAKLNTAFLAMGSTVQQAAESYSNLFRFLGDEDKSVEAASHLAKITTSQKELAEWTKICQGIYATFGDSLPIEGFTEAANETARVGKVTGTMADALTWAGVSEDAFNAKLAQTVSFEEREALIRSTLNGLYNDAAEIYERNNKALLEHNESQARMNASMADAGRSVMPLLTALNNLSAALFTALKPALDVIVPAMASFVNWVTQGIQAIMGLFGAVSGTSSSISSVATASAGVGSGIGNAAAGAGQLASGLNDAAVAAEKAKKATMGFDELNIVSSGSSSGSGGSSGGAGGAGGAGAPGYMAPTVGAQNFTMEVEQTEKKGSGLAATMKKIGAELKDVFAPTITAWSSGFKTIKDAWNDSKDNFKNGAVDIKSAFETLGSYVLGDFVPTLVNSFSTNLAPMITDGIGLAIEEAGKTFELFGHLIEDATNNIIVPALEVIKGVVDDTFTAVGDAWAEYGQPLLDQLSTALNHVRDTIETLYEEFIKPILDKVIKKANEVWEESLKPVVEKLTKALLSIGTDLLQLYNKFIAPIINWVISNILPKVKQAINKVIDNIGELLKSAGKILGGVIDVIKGVVSFVVGVFTMDWEKAWNAIKDIFKGLWDVICGIAEFAWKAIKNIFDPSGIKAFFSICWDVIKAVFSALDKWFISLFTAAWNGIKKAWGGVKDWFSGIWTNIKNVFSPVTDWFKNTFTKAWTAVKNVFSTGGKIFDGIKDGILSGLKSVVNALITGINKVISVPFNGINSALKKIRDVSILGAKPFDWMPTISVPQIPKLAKGGIIDRATLAMIGERGKEAVVPLENNTAWMDRLVDKLVSRSSGPSKIVLMLDGKELGWANINSINNITRQTGALQLVLG